MPDYLSDQDAEVKRAALTWAGTLLDQKWREALDLTLEGKISTPMFEAYLAAVENLSGTFANDFFQQKTTKAKQLKRSLDPAVLVRLIKHTDYSDDVRALALDRLDVATVKQERSWIEAQLLTSSGAFQLSAIRQLAKLDAVDSLTQLALDQRARPEARSEALLALASQAAMRPQQLVSLLDDHETDVAIETARTLRYHVNKAPIRDAFQTRLTTATGELADQLAYALEPASEKARPASIETWKAALAAGGHPARGRRVFFSTQFMCARCHSVDDGVALLGPSLAGIAQSVSREQIIHSILKPSDQFPPQYQAWIVHTKDGASHPGLQLDHQAAGAINMMGIDGKPLRFVAKDIASYEASPISLMPAGLETLMPVADFRNLIAFLASLN